MPSPAVSVSATPTSSEDSIQQNTLPVNMLHVELLHHLAFVTLPSFDKELKGVDVSFADILRHAPSAPYLINELLALGAMHLSTLRPGQDTFYRRQATELQTHALSIFNRMNMEVNTENCVPVFLFSSILALHMLCETLVFREGDWDTFMNRFTRYLHLHRGIRAVTRNKWNLLLGTSLRPLLQEGQSIPPMNNGLGNTCNKLSDLVKAADISPKHVNIYLQTIEALQSVFTASFSNAEGSPSFNIIVSWPVLLCSEYVELLRQRKPHALIILSHYAVLVHSRRDLWLCGDGGQFMIQGICQHLGRDWADWLVWPQRALSDPTGAIQQDGFDA